MVVLTLLLSDHWCDTRLSSVNHGFPWLCGQTYNGCMVFVVVGGGCGFDFCFSDK